LRFELYDYIQYSIFNVQPKVIDQADGNIEIMKDLNIRKRFALHFSIFNLQ